MAAYFRSSGSPNDLTLLPRWLRSDGDVAAICAEAEARVIAYYTVRAVDARYREEQGPTGLSPGVSPFADAYKVEDGLYVCLKGYLPDAADPAVPVTFAAAMRREIATVARWVAAQWSALESKNPLLASDSKEGQGVSYRQDAEHRFPPDFGGDLQPFDVRPTFYGL